MFESHAPEVDLAQIYANPVPVNDLQHLKTLKIANKQGSFLLENTHPEGNIEGPWQMLSPQSLKVKADVVQRVLDALNVIRVRNFYRLEPINITSFSLDNPTLTLTFTTSKDRPFEIKMGLINPIDNSAYMSLSSQNQIYQIDPIEMALESYDLPQLVESRVLALSPNSLASLELYGPKGPDLKLIKKENQWVDQHGTLLSESKIKKFFERLEEMKSFSILENLTADQQAFMENVMSKPLYSLKIVSSEAVRTYVVGEVLKGIPGMPLDKNNFYVLSPEDRGSFVLLEKQQIQVLNLKKNELK